MGTPSQSGTMCARPYAHRSGRSRACFHLRPMTLNLVRLLERRPVDPVDERLGHRAERAEVDRVVAPLVAVHLVLLADRVLVELRGIYAERLPERGREGRAAGAQAATAAVDPRERTRIRRLGPRRGGAGSRT